MALTLKPLPKLQIRMPIVSAQGMPSPEFHRFINIEFSDAIRANDEALAQVILDVQTALAQASAAEIAAANAVLVANAAQDTAELALTTAENSEGARYALFDSVMGPTTTAADVRADSLLDLTLSILGATIDANSDLQGQLELSENQGGAPTVVGLADFTLSSDGTQNPDLSWNTNATGISLRGTGTLDGTVNYDVQALRVSGSNFVTLPQFEGQLIITPKVAT